MPQQPLDPVKRCCLYLDCGCGGPSTLDHLPQHGQPHGDMEPVQHMLDFPSDVLLQAPQGVGAVG
jgi:hypothetical protein